MPPRRYIDLDSAATFLDCSIRTIQRLAKKGVLNSRKPKGRRGLTISVDSLGAYKEVKNEPRMSLEALAMRVRRLERIVDSVNGHDQMDPDHRRIGASKDERARKEIRRRHPEIFI